MNNLYVDLKSERGHFLPSYMTMLNGNGNVDVLKKLIIEKYYPMYKTNEIIIINSYFFTLYSVFDFVVKKPKDEIIIIGPHPSEYMEILKLTKGNPKVIDSGITDFKITSSAITKAITTNTQALIISEPSNPAGIVYNIKEKQTLTDLFNTLNIYIIVDEIFNRFVNKDYISFSNMINNDIRKKMMFVNGLEKSLMLKNYPLHYILADKDIIMDLEKTLSFNAPSSTEINAATGAISDNVFQEFFKRYYLYNRQLLVKELEFLKIDYVKGDNGYFVFMNTEVFNITGNEFCRYVHNKYNIAISPGYLYGVNYENYIRISCCNDVSNITDIIQVLRKMINYYRGCKEINTPSK